MFRPFSTIANFQQELIRSYLRKTSSLFICVNSTKLADQFCQKIGFDLKQGNKFVFEASPGDGILTEKLLQLGISKIRTFETIEKRLESLKLLQEKYGQNRLEVVDKNILDFANGNYKLLNISRDELSNICFNSVPIDSNWTREIDVDVPIESQMKLITALSPPFAREFLTFLIYSLVRFENFFLTGPTEFYLFVPLANYRQIISKPSKNLNHYTAFTIQINSLFDITEIDLYSKEFKESEKVKIDNRVHTIISNKCFALTNGRTLKTKDNFVFVKIKPKQNVNKYGPDFLINYVAFVKQSFMKRSIYAIKFYEKHFPGCAVELIGLGISYFKTLGDLTHAEMFQIFDLFYHMPQYRHSIFKDLC